MLTISEVARRHSLSNRQVHEMVRYGYLNVADIKRRSGEATYLFSNRKLIISMSAYFQEISYEKGATRSVQMQ